MASYKVMCVVTLLTLLTPESLSQLDADVCGQVPLSNRLLGLSLKVTDGKWPWMASLQKDGRHVCGGTLVNEDLVLSSADCFSSSATASDWTVVLGRLKQNGSNPFEVKLNVTDITLSNHTGSNAAALHLATPAPLSDSIQPICVDTGRNFSVGSTCWVAGWSSGAGGEEQVLQEFQTSVVDCEDTSSDSICTEALTLEQGFSGGPLMCYQDGSWFLAGVLVADNKLTTGTQAVQGKVVYSAPSSTPCWREVDSLVQWCGDNNLTLITDKTKEMIVDMRKERRTHQPLFIRELQVERMSNFKYLGVHISEDLTWTPHVTQLVKKDQQQLYFLRSLRKFGMSPKILSNFYSCVIESVLTNCITVWYSSTTVMDHKCLQRVVKTEQKITRPPLPSLQSI
ncbi:hypothetical protein Q8A73_012501 [Channa argus]|nr:hypothetical protein Q8A73_012501 [Channa argus]